MGLLGFVLGYLITLLPFLGLSRRISRTVATEVALQNAQVSGSVIQGSFASNLVALTAMISFPLMYYLAQCAYSVAFVLLYKFLKRKGYFSDEDNETIEEQETNVIENQYAKELPNINYSVEPNE